MKQATKIRVAVLYGGRSAEHEVSLASATNVIQHFDKEHFEVVPIGIDKQGAWFLGEDFTQKQLGENATVLLEQNAERMLFTPQLIGKPPVLAEGKDITSHLQSSERLFDVVFPAIHGTFCEDGTVQGMLELADIPYVGCGVLASAIGMDKDFSKRLVKDAGLAVPPFLSLKKGQWDKNPEQFCAAVQTQLTYPVFVKPANAGSSIGIQKVKEAKDLVAAIQNAFLYDTKILVEQGIDAIELEIAVLESLDYGAEPFVSMVGEIKPSHEFYSYEAKYLDAQGAEAIIPAPITPELQEEAKRIAKEVFLALDCEGMARVDLFLERGTNQIYFNELNTLPGFTQISMYPKLIMASGLGYTALLTHLVNLAMDKHARRAQLNRDYVAE